MEQIMPPTIAKVRSCIQESVDKQQNEIHRLRSERKNTVEGNMAFTFGYDSSINDYDRQIIQATNLLATLDSQVMQTLIVRDADTEELEAFALVDQGGGRTVLVGEWQVQLISTDTVAGSQMLYCNVGTVLSFGLVVSMDGGPILTRAEQQLALASKHRDSAKEQQVRLQRERVADIARAERMADTAREEQREQQAATRIRKEAVEAKQKREVAEQKALLVQQEAFRVRQEAFRVQQEALRMQENLLRQREENKRQQERESQRREHHFVTELALREKRLNLDVSRLAKYPELIHHTKRLTVEQEIQATFTVPGLEYTPLLEIELNQAIEHEMKSLFAFREEANLIENLAKEQELQEAQRLRQQQIIQQEKVAKRRAIAIDKRAAQFDRSTGPIAYEEAAAQIGSIKHHIEEGANSHITWERAAHLRSRCLASQSVVPSTSAQTPASEGTGTKVGAIMGGIFGIIGGPFGMAVGAVVGGFIGNIADHAGDSATDSQATWEQRQWTALIRDIDELTSKLP